MDAPAKLHDFIEHVVLDNCLEYFKVSEHETNQANIRARQQRLMNAVTGLDRAVYQAFFAQDRVQRFEDFLAELVEREPAISHVRELSSALKRNRTGAELVDLRLATSLCAGTHHMLQSAFEFWFDYATALRKASRPSLRPALD